MCSVWMCVSGAQQGSKRADGGSGDLQLLLQRPDPSDPAAPLAAAHDVHGAAVQGNAVQHTSSGSKCWKHFTQYEMDVKNNSLHAHNDDILDTTLFTLVEFAGTCQTKRWPIMSGNEMCQTSRGQSLDSLILFCPTHFSTPLYSSPPVGGALQALVLSVIPLCAELSLSCCPWSWNSKPLSLSCSLTQSDAFNQRFWLDQIDKYTEMTPMFFFLL